jgi:hypothetical protein
VIRPGRRTSHPIGTCRIVTCVFAALVLVGCAPTAPSDGSAPAGTGALPPPETAQADAPAPSEVVLPWPAATVADASALQAEVDRGAQPWLLDPSEVGIAYAAAAHGWLDAEAYPGPDGTSVDVRTADGERLTLSLAQPARPGSDGIWVVTAEHRSR